MPELSSFWQRHRVHSFHQFRDELRQFLEYREIPSTLRNTLILVTQEACNNACRHDHEGSCDVSVTCLESTVMIEVADHGDGFDFEEVKAAWPPRLLDADGRGLFIIAELTDGIEVIRRQSGTLVRIFKAIE